MTGDPYPLYPDHPAQPPGGPWPPPAPGYPGPVPPNGFAPSPYHPGPVVPPPSNRNRLLIAVAVGVVALLAVVGVLLFTHGGPGSVSPKPDITDLTAPMLLTQSDFQQVAQRPKIAEVKVRSNGIETLEQDFTDSNASRCALPVVAGIGAGDQRSAVDVSIATTDGGTISGVYKVQLLRGGTHLDMASWAAKCLPLNQGSTVTAHADITGLPGGMIGIAETRNGAPSLWGAVGQTRGVTVMIATKVVGSLIPSGQAKADLVKIVAKQIDKLDAA